MRNDCHKIIVCLSVLVCAAVIASRGWCGESPSNARDWHPCPSEWLEEAGFFVERGIIPGALIMVDSPVWGLRIGTAGRADLASPAPPGPGMRYRVGGLTRLMLSTVILQLEREGALALDHTIDRLLGDGMVGNGHEITLRDCLKMQSGLYDYARADSLIAPAGSRNAGYSPDEILHTVRVRLNTESAIPGDGFSPSDTGYLLAGMVVEKVEGKALSRVFAERIFAPLGMSDSVYPESVEVTEPAAHGYENMAGIPVDCTEYHPSHLGASKGIVSTPFDILRFLHDLFEDHTLLPDRSYALMAMLSNAEREEDSYGLGLRERISRRGTWRGVQTSIRGYSVMAGYYMTGDTYVAIFVNTGENTFAVEEMYREVLRRVSGCPVTTTPPDGSDAGAVDGGLRLSWQSGFVYGDSYRVYLGSDRNSVRTAAPGRKEGVRLIEIDGDTFHADVDGLVPERRYYWRVEACRAIPDIEMNNRRKWRDTVRSRNPHMPWTPVPERECITGPVQSFKIR